MKKKDYFLVTAIVFLAIFALHGLRVVFNWEAVIAGWVVPMWFSWAIVVIAGYLSYTGFLIAGYVGGKKK
ncbi:hypothetical protein CL630_03285 [bacterium]|nr:hypothetical protein [bacterium]|tara:strand:- start:27043 stop:27252 length:210 start_codon:yes stop_codon:yes gene_type:complete